MKKEVVQENAGGSTCGLIPCANCISITGEMIHDNWYVFISSLRSLQLEEIEII